MCNSNQILSLEILFLLLVLAFSPGGKAEKIPYICSGTIPKGSLLSNGKDRSVEINFRSMKAWTVDKPGEVLATLTWKDEAGKVFNFGTYRLLYLLANQQMAIFSRYFKSSDENFFPPNELLLTFKEPDPTPPALSPKFSSPQKFICTHQEEIL